MATFDDFQKLDIRVGRVIEVSDFPEAHKPAYKLRIDFGEGIGVKNSSAQITTHKKEDLVGKIVLCVVNFAPKKVGPFLSEVLTLGVPDGKGNWIVITPLMDVPIGGRLA